jgi:hypothetical protein
MTVLAVRKAMVVAECAYNTTSSDIREVNIRTFGHEKGLRMMLCVFE